MVADQVVSLFTLFTTTMVADQVVSLFTLFTTTMVAHQVVSLFTSICITYCTGGLKQTSKLTWVLTASWISFPRPMVPSHEWTSSMDSVNGPRILRIAPIADSTIDAEYWDSWPIRAIYHEQYYVRINILPPLWSCTTIDVYLDYARR